MYKCCINVAGEKLTKLIKSLLYLNIVFASLNTNRTYRVSKKTLGKTGWYFSKLFFNFKIGCFSKYCELL